MTNTIFSHSTQEQLHFVQTFDKMLCLSLQYNINQTQNNNPERKTVNMLNMQ